MKKTKSKKEIDKMFSESQVIILLEDIRDDIKVLAEGQLAIKEDLASFKKETYEFQEETRNNFKVVMKYLSNIGDELTEIKAEIKYLKKVLTDKADLERLRDLEKRVAVLEQERMIVQDGKGKYEVKS